MRKLAWLAAALSLAYACAIVAWQVLRLLYGDPWWLALINTMSPWMFLPLLLLLPLDLFVAANRSAGPRRWLPLAVTAVPLAIWLLLYGGLFLPKRAPVVAGGAEPLRVMTFNVLYDAHDVDGLEQIIRAGSPDLVLLQELTPALAAELAPRLETAYPHSALLPQEGTTGLGVFSRYPLHHEGTLPEPEPRNHVWWTNSTQAMTLDYGGQPVLVLNVHARPPAYPWPIGRWPTVLDAEYRYREEEIRRLLVRVAQHHGPVIAAGDFNFVDQSVAYGLMASQLDDAQRRVGWGFGHTSPATPDVIAGLPVPARSFRIDYVWYSDHWQALDVKVGEPAAGSDHLPVFATLVLK